MLTMLNHLKCVFVLCLFIEINCVVSSEKWKSIIERTRETILKYNLINATRQSLDPYNDEKCFNDTKEFYEGIEQSQHWAVKMYDSWGNFPSGILSGNVYDLGYFDECFFEDKNTQYCLVEIVITTRNSRGTSNRSLLAVKPEILKSNNTIKILVGTCYPSSCSPDLTAVLYQTLIDDFDVVVHPSNIRCYINNSNDGLNFTPMQIFTICLFSLITFLIVSSTVVELFVEIKENHPLLKVWKAFSAYENLSDLCDTQVKKKENKFACLDGLRAISIVWVVYGHSILNIQRSAVINKVDVELWSQDLWTSISWSTFNFAVDTFFVIGGFLATRTIKKQFEKDHRPYTKIFFSIPKMWFHRYLRLAPVVISVVLFFTTFGTQLGKGPFWNSMMYEIEFCYDSWWSTVLFIQNYASPGKMCLGHLWYLAVDIQMFIITSILLFLIHWKGLRYLWIAIVMIITNISYNVYWYWYFTTEEVSQYEQQKLIYYPTHARLTSWLIGVILANIYFKYFAIKAQIKISSPLLLIGYIYCVLVVGLVVANFSATTNRLTPAVSNAVFDSFSRLLWSSVIALIILKCITNNGGPVNTFLSSPIWKPLAKLSFCIYVLHYVIQLIMIGQNRTTIFMNNVSLVERFWSDFGITITVSVFWTLAFEMPFRIIERINCLESNVLPIRTPQSYVNQGADQES